MKGQSTNRMVGSDFRPTLCGHFHFNDTLVPTQLVLLVATCRARTPRSIPPNEGRRLAHPFGPIGLDDVAVFEVDESFDCQAALEAGRHLADIVAEVLEAGHGAGYDFRTAAKNSDRRASSYRAVVDVDSGNLRPPTEVEHGSNSRATLEYVFVDGLQHALERVFDIFGQVVDNVVITDLDAFGASQRAGAGLRLRVETEDDRLGRHGKHDIALGDESARRVDDVDFRLLGVEFLQRAANRFNRALDIGLDDEVE